MSGNKLQTCIKRDPVRRKFAKRMASSATGWKSCAINLRSLLGVQGCANDFVLACQRVQAKIHKMCKSTLIGAHSDEENEDESGNDIEYKEEVSSESEEESKQEGVEDGGTEEVENVDVLTVPGLPLIQDQDDSLQHDIVAICGDDVGEDIGDVDQPAICTAANVATPNEAAPVNNVTTMKEAATVQDKDQKKIKRKTPPQRILQPKQRTVQTVKELMLDCQSRSSVNRLAGQVKIFQDTSIEV
ncbi:hypothetical protein ACHAW6_009035 [Cyclotella cf. meneghiniana]